MKKGLCILLVFAVIFCLAACGKNSKGEIYTPPHTEVITFEDGESAIYEVVTDDKGKPVTDDEGITELAPYDPPVTEDGGYLVTTPEGETIKQSQTTVAQSVEIDHELIEFDTTASSANETTSKREDTTTLKAETTTAANNGALVTPNKTETTTRMEIPKGETYPLNGTLSKEDAQRLVSILSISNEFDDALSDGDYYKAEALLSDHLSNIQNAIGQIKADKTLYAYVGNKNLQLWYDYMVEAADMYAIFMGVVRGTEGEKPSKAFYATYGDFQEYYLYSLQVYYHMKTNAEIIIHS